MCFLEHLWCSFEKSKTPSFYKISVDFVLLKQIQKIHTQWLRQAQSPYYLLLHSVPERSRRHILTSHLGAWACRRHIISIALKIRAIYRTSLMFLWELKNGIISQNLREVCVIKINTNIPHTVASTSSATVLFITTHAALACWRHVLNSHLGAWACWRHHYFYCIKIRVLSRTSLMFLWELKNAIISTKSSWTLCY